MSQCFDILSVCLCALHLGTYATFKLENQICLSLNLPCVFLRGQYPYFMCFLLLLLFQCVPVCVYRLHFKF